MSGWIKLHREIVDSDIYQMPPLYLRVFERLLLEANHKDNTIPFKHSGDDVTTKKLIRRGERLTSIRSISEWVGWYENGIFKKPNSKTIKEILDWLEHNSMIEIYPRISNRDGTHYKIVNYNTYQDKNSEEVTVKKQLGNSEETVTGSKQECLKNDKNVKKIDRSMETEIEIILFKWNKILNTQISELTNNEMFLVMESINKNGIDRVLETIDKISDSKYLLGHITKKKVSIDWFFKDNNFIKVNNDHYKDIKETEKPMINRKTKFHNFEQRSDNYTAEELEDIARKKRQAYDKKIEEENQKLRKEE